MCQKKNFILLVGITVLCAQFIDAMEEKAVWKTVRRYEAGGGTQEYWRFGFYTQDAFFFSPEMTFHGAIADRLEWSDPLDIGIEDYFIAQQGQPDDFKEGKCIPPYFVSLNRNKRVIVAQKDDYSSILVSQILTNQEQKLSRAPGCLERVKAYIKDLYALEKILRANGSPV